MTTHFCLIALALPPSLAADKMCSRKKEWPPECQSIALRSASKQGCKHETIGNGCHCMSMGLISRAVACFSLSLTLFFSLKIVFFFSLSACVRSCFFFFNHNQLPRWKLRIFQVKNDTILICAVSIFSVGKLCMRHYVLMQLECRARERERERFNFSVHNLGSSAPTPLGNKFYAEKCPQT